MYHAIYAHMLELVDKKDLKSFGHYDRTGSSPVMGTTPILI